MARFIRSGALGGAASTLLFAGIHAVFISDIWFSLIPMMMAGAACGVCVTWTYALLFPKPAVGSWIGYNVLYLVMFLLLGAASVVYFDPVTTVAAVIQANEPPSELISAAMPLTLIFLVTFATLLGVLFARRWQHYAALLLTCVVLVTLLGLNISVIGLVEVPGSSIYLILQLFGLVIILNVVYVVAVMALERQRFLRTMPRWTG